MTTTLRVPVMTTQGHYPQINTRKNFVSPSQCAQCATGTPYHQLWKNSLVGFIIDYGEGEGGGEKKEDRVVFQGTQIEAAVPGVQG